MLFDLHLAKYMLSQIYFDECVVGESCRLQFIHYMCLIQS